MALGFREREWPEFARLVVFREVRIGAVALARRPRGKLLSLRESRRQRGGRGGSQHPFQGGAAIDAGEIFHGESGGRGFTPRLARADADCRGIKPLPPITAVI